MQDFFRELKDRKVIRVGLPLALKPRDQATRYKALVESFPT